MVSAGWTVGEALLLESGRVDWGSEYSTDSVTLREAPSPSWAIRIREVDLVVSLKPLQTSPCVICSLILPGSVPGLGRSPGEGNGNPLQYSCLENPHGQRSLVG